MAAHARLGPSNHRWPRCPGSVREEAAYPDISGADAIDGTGSHLLLELCLDNGVRAEAYEGEIIGVGHSDMPQGWVVHRDRCDRVQMCLDYVSRRVKELKEQFPNANVEVLSETRSDPGAITNRDDWWGTVDITMTVMEGTACRYIEIIDYKDGRGWVHVPKNTQLISYLSGKMAPFVYIDGIGNNKRIMDASAVGGCRVTVVQPKTNPVVRSEPMLPEDVAHEHFLLAKAARKTDDPDAPLVPGKHCTWCKHKKNCSAETEQAIKKVKPMSNNIVASGGVSLFEVVEQTIGDISRLSDAQLADLADAKDGILAAFDRVDLEIERRIETGIKVPGYEKAPGNGSQVWALSEEEVVKKLKSARLKKADIYPAKLLSPAQMQKHPNLSPAQRKRLTEELVTVKAGSVKLKKVSRDSARSSVEEMFGDVVATQASPAAQVTHAAEQDFINSNHQVAPDGLPSFL